MIKVVLSSTCVNPNIAEEVQTLEVKKANHSTTSAGAKQNK